MHRSRATAKASECCVFNSAKGGPTPSLPSPTWDAGLRALLKSTGHPVCRDRFSASRGVPTLTQETPSSPVSAWQGQLPTRTGPLSRRSTPAPTARGTGGSHRWRQAQSLRLQGRNRTRDAAPRGTRTAPGPAQRRWASLTRHGHPISCEHPLRGKGQDGTLSVRCV